MKPSELLTESIKRTLRARGLSYARLAERIGCSEASVKRMFANKNFDLNRLDRVVDALDEDLAELVSGAGKTRTELESLSREHEAAIVANPELFTVAVCALHQLSLEQMTSIYRITPASAIRCLVSLDRMEFLTLHPNNVYRLRLSRTFRWLSDGPIMRHFREQASHFLEHAFDGPGETLRVINVRVSNDKRLALLRRLEELAREYSEAHRSDAPLPLGKRHPMSLLVAVRSWEPKFMQALRRLDDAALASWLRLQESPRAVVTGSKARARRGRGPVPPAAVSAGG